MSYCRWSNDGFQCDVYCYEDEDGYVTHVAARRRPRPVADLDWDMDPELFMQAWREREQALDAPDNQPVPIGLPLDGESFHDDSLISFFTTLVNIKQMGYNVPQYVIDGVGDEIALDFQSKRKEG